MPSVAPCFSAAIPLVQVRRHDDLQTLTQSAGRVAPSVDRLGPGRRPSIPGAKPVARAGLPKGGHGSDRNFSRFKPGAFPVPVAQCCLPPVSARPVGFGARCDQINWCSAR